MLQDDKPYVASGAICVRKGPNSQKLTAAEEIRGFFQSNNRIYFDSVPCPRFNIDEEFDKKNFKQFLLVSSISGNVSTQQTLTDLQTFDESRAIKNGGVLFFGQQPETFFPQAIVCCVRFKGATKVHIIDDKIYGGPLYQQISKCEEMREAGLPEPIFSTDGGFFTVGFSRPKKDNTVKTR